MPRRLAGPVVAHQADDLAHGELEVDIDERLDDSEALRHPSELKQGEIAVVFHGGYRMPAASQAFHRRLSSPAVRPAAAAGPIGDSPVS